MVAIRIARPLRFTQIVLCSYSHILRRNFIRIFACTHTDTIQIKLNRSTRLCHSKMYPFLSFYRTRNGDIECTSSACYFIAYLSCSRCQHHKCACPGAKIKQAPYSSVKVNPGGNGEIFQTAKCTILQLYIRTFALGECYCASCFTGSPFSTIHQCSMISTPCIKSCCSCIFIKRKIYMLPGNRYS